MFCGQPQGDAPDADGARGDVAGQREEQEQWRSPADADGAQDDTEGQQEGSEQRQASADADSAPEGTQDDAAGQMDEHEQHHTPADAGGAHGGAPGQHETPAQWRSPPPRSEMYGGTPVQQRGPMQRQPQPPGGNRYGGAPGQQGGPMQWQTPPAGVNQQGGQYPPPVYQPRLPMICSISEIYRRVLAILVKKPILLWGISLMCMLLTYLAVITSILVPIICIPIVATLSFGMVSVYLAGYRNQPIESAMLFTGFKQFRRVAGGMLWMMLWIFIWALIPLVGIIMAIIKSYSYRFVPYLLLTQPDIGATDTLKKSMEMTNGYKGKMFGADILVGIVVFVVLLVLALLGTIRVIGGFFTFLEVLVGVVCVIFLPLFMGLIGAAFYDEIERVQQ